MGIQDPGGLALIPLATILVDLTRVRKAMDAAQGGATGRMIDLVKVVWANEEFNKAFGLGEEGVTPAALHAFGASGGSRPSRG